MAVRTLGKGFLGTTEAVLYTVPNNSECRTTIITIVNQGDATVALNLYKKSGDVNYSLCPFNMEFPASYMAQEDGPITLNSNDSIVGTSSIADVVTFLVDGEENVKSKT